MENPRGMAAFYEYELYKGDTLILTASATCGVFSDEDLGKSSGIIESKRKIPYKQTKALATSLHCPKTSFDEEDIVNLHKGNARLVLVITTKA